MPKLDAVTSKSSLGLDCVFVHQCSHSLSLDPSDLQFFGWLHPNQRRKRKQENTKQKNWRRRWVARNGCRVTQTNERPYIIQKVWRYCTLKLRLASPRRAALSPLLLLWHKCKCGAGLLFVPSQRVCWLAKTAASYLNLIMDNGRATITEYWIEDQVLRVSFKFAFAKYRNEHFCFFHCAYSLLHFHLHPLYLHSCWPFSFKIHLFAIVATLQSPLRW